MLEASGRESKRCEEQRNTAKTMEETEHKEKRRGRRKRRRNPTTVSTRTVRACVSVCVEVLCVCGTLFAGKRGG